MCDTSKIANVKVVYYFIMHNYGEYSTYPLKRTFDFQIPSDKFTEKNCNSAQKRADWEAVLQSYTVSINF